MDKTRKTTSKRGAASYKVREEKPSFLRRQDALFIRRPAPDASQPMVPPAQQMSQDITPRGPHTQSNSR